jgi:hypothetical protein
MHDTQQPAASIDHTHHHHLSLSLQCMKSPSIQSIRYRTPSKVVICPNNKGDYGHRTWN